MEPHICMYKSACSVSSIREHNKREKTLKIAFEKHQIWRVAAAAAADGILFICIIFNKVSIFVCGREYVQAGA